ncbi:hypothetical protein [Helicobacter himalayensis]|uniref:hypothetical protein n=1 Tax=Helicobacter himalayensis TaxID=1591088 RepID=UPI000835E200|nr:hypothetical protein [Helicobacter himalayensis]
MRVDFVKGIQRYPLSNTLCWLSFGKPTGQKIWGNFLDNLILQQAYDCLTIDGLNLFLQNPLIGTKCHFYNFIFQS